MDVLKTLEKRITDAALGRAVMGIPIVTVDAFTLRPAAWEGRR
jgi:hypothetical protein